MAYGKIKADSIVYDNSGSDVDTTIASLVAPKEGTAIISTGESGTTKFLRVDGDGTCSWQVPPDTNTQLTLIDEDNMASDDATKPPSQQSVKAYVDTADALKAPTANPTFTGTVNAAALTLSGDLTVGGTTTTVSSTTVEVADKNLELGKVSTPTDTTADGGGITLKGTTDKTITWVDATNYWTFNQSLTVKQAGAATVIVGSTDASGASIVLDGDSNGDSNGGDYSYIQHDTAGDLNIIVDNPAANGNIFLKSNGGTYQAVGCLDTGVVELRYQNAKKFETTAAGVTVTGTVSDSKGDVRLCPKHSITSALTVTGAEAGKHIYTNANVTIPASGGVSGLEEGTMITVINRGTSDITIIPQTSSGMEFYVAGDTTLYTSARTLTPKGMVTILYVTSQLCWLSGSGIS